jgi:hypothetical protein
LETQAGWANGSGDRSQAKPAYLLGKFCHQPKQTANFSDLLFQASSDSWVIQRFHRIFCSLNPEECYSTSFVAKVPRFAILPAHVV